MNLGFYTSVHIQQMKDETRLQSKRRKERQTLVQHLNALPKRRPRSSMGTVTMTRGVDIRTCFVDLRMDDEARGIDFQICATYSTTLLIYLHEMGDGHLTEVHGVGVYPEGGRVDWVWVIGQ